MKKQIEAKLKQAEEQLVAWRQNLAQAQEQCIRLDSVAQVCREFLAEDVAVVDVPFIGAKLQKAEEQSVVWRQNLAQAQEQCIRWDAAAQVCRELLAEEDTPVVDVPVVDVPVVVEEESMLKDKLAKAEKQLAELIAQLKEYGVDPDWSMSETKAYLVQKHLAGV